MHATSTALGPPAGARRLASLAWALLVALSLLAAGLWQGAGIAAAATPELRDGAAGELTPGMYLGSATGEGLAATGTRVEPGAKPRIVGGGPSTIAESPWQVSLGIHPKYDATYGFSNQLQRHFCGGSLVSSRYVLTAAHCLFDMLREEEWMEPGDFQIVSGRTQLTSAEGQVHEITDYYIPIDAEGYAFYAPDYYGHMGFDFVLVELATPSSSKTIKIAGTGERLLWAAGRDAFITGWGHTSEGGSKSDVLKRAKIKMLADSRCQSQYGPGFVAELMACAGHLAGGIDSCQADSGGPLTVGAGGGEFRLAGATSFGLGCARPNVPGVYARVADPSLSQWLARLVKSVTGENILGTSAQCVAGRKGLEQGRKAKKRSGKALKTAKAKLKRARRSGSAAKVAKAKAQVKKASKQGKKAAAQIRAAEAAIAKHCR